MAQGAIRSVKSKYKHVQGISTIVKLKVKWIFRMRGVTGKVFDTEREAAIAADKYLISRGKKPVNILKPL